jgi:hypothetical protein
MPSCRSQPGSEESPAATLASVASLLEEIARVEKETAELLWKLAHAQDEAAIQPLSKAKHPVQLLTSLQNGVSAQPGSGERQLRQAA